ncbi:hypothetical protein CAPN004_11540 [Capnocytophaga cynodegmi]|uniref:hypothetical protein n=1 Tax=Capnocytophaga cynodegmi TaxID=28189 RepID=UPI001AC04C27|nr:hypothetical protein [Capnocytophaga cynodegmi]GIM52124.1 hypothetical protein CAPN004_11540 [Capnocytophaga cynodegmi]
MKNINTFKQKIATNKFILFVFKGNRKISSSIMGAIIQTNNKVKYCGILSFFIEGEASDFIKPNTAKMTTTTM